MATYDNKPLDGNGLSHLWTKIKSTFAAKTEIPAAGSTTPVMDGTGATGTSAAYARADHVHPTDTSRAPLASPTFTGTPKAPTAAAGTNTTQIATTEFVKAAVDAKADTNTTYTLSGALSSHKVTSTLTPSSGTATTSDFTLAAGTGITITDDATNRKMTIATTAEANQNAFSNVKVGSTTVAADAKTDTLELVAGSNVTITPDATNDKITIAATDTTYSDATTSAHGLMSKTDKGKLDTVSYNATAVSWNESTRVLTITEQTTSTGGSTSDEVQIPSSYTHPSYTAASAAAVKVGRDATGHVVIGDALTASDVGASATGHKHAAGDITSGTIGVARGGTGASTLGAGVVYHRASGTGALSIATAANLVSAIGTNAVARATADASGNNIADTYAKKSEITGVYKYKGSVAAEANLPASPSTGDVYNIESASTYGAAGANVAWNGTAWDSLGEVFALDPLTNSEIDAICV